MVPKADSGTFLLLFLLVLSVTEPLRSGRGGGGAGGAGPGCWRGEPPGWPGTARSGGRSGPEPAPPGVWALLPLCAFKQSRDAAEHRCALCRLPGFALGVGVKRLCQSVKAWVEIYITLRVMSAENVATKFSGACYLPAFMLWALDAYTAGQNACFRSAV